MKLKTTEIDGTTYAEVQDGHPVYIDGDREVPFKAAEAKAKIKSQADELAEAQGASGDLAKWQKLGDLAEVRKAVHTLKALGDKGIDPEDAAIKLAEAQAEAESLRETVAERDEAIAGLRSENFDLGVGGQLKGTKWVDENMLPGFAEDRDAVVELYGRYIKPSENGGGPVFLDREGKPLKVDGANPTIEQFLDHHVRKAYRRPSGAEGSGDTGGGPTSTGGGSAPKHKGDFKSVKAKTEWVDEHGLEAFQNLPVNPKTQPSDKPPAVTPGVGV